MRVCLDYGHGGKDSGCIGGSILEKDIVKLIGKQVKDLLNRNNIEVIETRKGDEYVTLSDRCIISNNNNCDLFVSIHANAMENSSVKGFEIYHAPSSINGARLSKLINDEIVSSNLLNNNRGIKENTYTVLTGTTAPATLIELGFLTNIDDRTLIINNQNSFALAIAKGVIKYFNKDFINFNNTNVNNKIFRVQCGAFKTYNNALKLSKDLKSKGYDCIIIKDGNLHKVQVGAYKLKTNADRIKEKLNNQGYNCFIV